MKALSCTHQAGLGRGPSHLEFGEHPMSKKVPIKACIGISRIRTIPDTVLLGVVEDRFTGALQKRSKNLKPSQVGDRSHAGEAID